MSLANMSLEIVNHHGLCRVIAAGGQGKVLAENKLPGTFFATPALSDGVIYLRGHSRLYAVGRLRPRERTSDGGGRD